MIRLTGDGPPWATAGNVKWREAHVAVVPSASAFLNGGEWTWTPSGYDAADLEPLGHVAVDLRICGQAAAAGVSFGDYKDLLAPVDGERFLQFDVDWRSGRWTFQADARVGAPQWWNAKLRTIDDLRGPLLFKAHHPRQVVFSDLRVRPLDSSCRLSVVVTCHRFAQRLRVTLRGWSQQTLPAGALEVIVVNPGSPDQTHDVVLAAAQASSLVRVREVSVDGRLFLNKGKLINLGVALARGEWIWLSDADCLFPPDAATRAMAQADSHRKLFYCERRHLTEAATSALVSQRTGATLDYESLLAHTRSDTNFVPWGYCQLAHRSVFEAIRYREDVESFSNSDITFMESCRANGVEPVPLDGVSCLHLVHPWAWQGTRDLL